MKGRSKILCAVMLLTLLVGVPSLWAQWIADGVPVCTAAGDREKPQIISDGAGGAIITWYEYRAGNWDIYAQRVNASGQVLWTADGVAVCTAAGVQQSTQITSDGSAGAIIAWHDFRAGKWDIYAQRVNSSGVAQWTANGVAVCTATGGRYNLQIISDCAGGAIITWEDYRAGKYDIYAQRVGASGAVQWTADGVAVCTTTEGQYSPQIASDGAGGAIITWEDYRAGNFDIYAQRVSASGAVQWTANGVAVCTATGGQYSSQVISDGAGGAIITWRDQRAGNWDIYAQRVNASGAARWTANGVGICTAAGDQYFPQLISDGSGGAIITWADNRAGSLDIFAQRVNLLGAVQWLANGIGISTDTGTQDSPQITSDGSGGAIITWRDFRSGNADIYAQRVNILGQVQWTDDGVAVCTATGSQQSPQINTDGSGGAIITWEDYRAGNWDIYAQQVDRIGRIGFSAPDIHAVRDVPGDQGGWVYLSWYAARMDRFMDSQMSHYTLWRAISPERAALAFACGAAALGSFRELDLDERQPMIRLEQSGGRTFFWELVATQDAYYLPAYGKAVATLFDSTGVCSEYHYFQVVAHTTDPRVFWVSAPDSGYSVDNLAPCTPQRFAGEQSFVPEGLSLTWAPNREADLFGYRIYRGLAEDFTPDKDNLVAATSDTLLFDSGWHWSAGYYYKLSALDVNGNESGWALLRPEDVTGAEDPGTPLASYLAQNYPNPFNPSTTIVFALAGPGRVSLRVYDATGRLVRVLVDEHRAGGRYEAVWDGTDAAGRAVASGVYFYRLEAGEYARTRKMILLR